MQSWGGENFKNIKDLTDPSAWMELYICVLSNLYYITWISQRISKYTIFAFEVDFDAPLGYKEPERQMQHPEEPTVCSDKRPLHHTTAQYYNSHRSCS